MVTEFISEIGTGLLEVERQYLDSISQTGRGHTKTRNLTVSSKITWRT